MISRRARIHDDDATWSRPAATRDARARLRVHPRPRLTSSQPQPTTSTPSRASASPISPGGARVDARTGGSRRSSCRTGAGSPLTRSMPYRCGGRFVRERCCERRWRGGLGRASTRAARNERGRGAERRGEEARAGETPSRACSMGKRSDRQANAPGARGGAEARAAPRVRRARPRRPPRVEGSRRLARRRQLFATKTAVARAKAAAKNNRAWKSTILAARRVVAPVVRWHAFASTRDARVARVARRPAAATAGAW